MTNEFLLPPGHLEADDLVQLAKDVIGMIPGVGGLAATIFNQIVPDPYKERLEQVVAKVCLRLNEMNDGDGFPWEKIKSNPQFQTALVQAYRRIQETTMKEKLDAYENALVNIALNREITETKVTLFFNLLERFTVQHLVLLNFLDNPREYINKINATLPKSSTPSHREIFQAVMPQLLLETDLTELIMGELISSSLITSNSFDYGIPIKEYLNGQTRPIGKEFLRFISKRPDA